MRFLACLAVALTLAACNRPQLHAEGPLLTAAAGAKALRSGIWLWVDADCAVDRAAPRRAWPACAQSSLIAQDREVQTVMTQKGPRERSVPLVLADGSPMALQTLEARAGTGDVYVFEAAAPTATDAAGRIVALWRQPIGCTIPSPASAGDGRAADQAPDPALPGVGDDCVAPSAEVVLNAAKLIAPKHGVEANFVWVRDGDS